MAGAEGSPLGGAEWRAARPWSAPATRATAQRCRRWARELGCQRRAPRSRPRRAGAAQGTYRPSRAAAPSGRRPLEQRRRQTIAGLEQRRRQTIARLEQRRRQTITRLEQRRRQTIAGLEQRRRQTITGLEQRRRQTITGLEQRRRQTITGLEAAGPSDHRPSQAAAPSDHRPSQAAAPSDHHRSRAAARTGRRRSQAAAPSGRRPSRAAAPSDHRPSQGAGAGRAAPWVSVAQRVDHALRFVGDSFGLVGNLGWSDRCGRQRLGQVGRRELHPWRGPCSRARARAPVDRREDLQGHRRRAGADRRGLGGRRRASHRGAGTWGTPSGEPADAGASAGDAGAAVAGAGESAGATGVEVLGTLGVAVGASAAGACSAGTGAGVGSWTDGASGTGAGASTGSCADAIPGMARSRSRLRSQAREEARRNSSMSHLRLSADSLQVRFLGTGFTSELLPQSDTRVGERAS